MNSTGSNTATSTTNPADSPTGAAEQLCLLSSPSVPLQFRLDERTRRSGLQHVAQLRAMMADQAANRRNGAGGRAAQRATNAPQRSAAA